MGQEYFGEQNRQYTKDRSQYTLATALLNKIPRNGRILDVGSGLGEFSDFLLGQGYEVVGVEGVGEFVLKQRQRGLEVQQVDLETEAFPFEDNGFDIVVSLDVIEHLWNTEHYLGEINRCLKPGGYFVASTINYNYWRYRWLHLQGRMEDFMFGSRHKKFYTYKSFFKELSAYFDIQDEAHFNEAVVGSVRRPNLQALQIAFLSKSRKS